MRSFSCWPALGRLVILCVGFLICPQSAFAELSTLAEVYVDVFGTCTATGGLQPPGPFGCLRATTPSATVTNDSATSSWLGTASANAATTFGTNKASIDLYQAQISPFDSSMSLVFQYSLDLLSPDGTSRRLIDAFQNPIGLAFLDPVNTILTAHLVLSRDVPYEIRSSLRLSGENAFTSAIALSEWSDVLTFTGGAGDNPIADLMVGLDGVLFAEEVFLPKGTSGTGCSPGDPCDDIFTAPTWVHHSHTDFGDSVNFAIAVDDGRIQTGSGTTYPTSVPEPTSLTMLAIGIAFFGFLAVCDLKSRA